MNMVDDLLAEARGILGNSDLHDKETLRYMARNYDGGWWAFVAYVFDDYTEDEVNGAIANRFGLGFVAELQGIATD